jgi:phage terminase small subunit
MTLRLTARQRQFVETYVRTGDSHLAVVQAGFSRKRIRGAAYDCLRNPRICAEIERRQKAPLDEIVKKASDVSPEFLLTTLTEALGDIERTGSTGAAMTGNRLRAIELIVRVKELQAKAATEPAHNPFEGLDDAALEQKIAKLHEELGIAPPVPPEAEPDPVPDPPDAPWKATVPATVPVDPPSPPPNPKLPSIEDIQRMKPCPRDGNHPPYKSLKDRRGRWSECPACRELWAAGNNAEARRWNQNLLPADPR